MTEFTWQWSVVTEHLPALTHGALVTVIMAVLVTVSATVMGMGLGTFLAARAALFAPLRWALNGVLRVIAAIPVLVLLVGVHLSMPISAGWLHRLFGRLEPLREQAGAADGAVIDAMTSAPFASAVLALTAALTARIAETMRRSIDDVPAGLVDAGRAQGMSRRKVLTRVLVPETMRRALPELLKNCLRALAWTTLAAFIGCTEVLRTAIDAAQGGGSLELLAVTAAAFAIVFVPATLFIHHLERSRWLARETVQ